MLVELQRFVEFGDDWHKHEPRRREDMKFAPMLINTKYVGWVKRWEIYAGDGLPCFQLCEVHMADRGGGFELDITYEDMKALLESERKDG